MTGNLYRLDTVPVQKALLATNLEVWHRRLAHVQPSAIQEMAKSNTVTGLNVQKSENEDFSCTGCAMGKGTRATIPKQSSTNTSKLLESFTPMCADLLSAPLLAAHVTL